MDNVRKEALEVSPMILYLKTDTRLREEKDKDKSCEDPSCN